MSEHQDAEEAPQHLCIQFQVSRPVYTEKTFAEQFPNPSKCNSTRPPKTFSENAKRFIAWALPLISCHQRKQEWLYKRLPIIEWLPKYRLRNDVFPDVCGGLTVGIIQVVQGLAFAMLASLPPVTGLYTALLPVFIYMVMGTSRYLSQGTFPIVCIMVAQVVEREVLKWDGIQTTMPLSPSNETNTHSPTGPSTGLLWSPLDAKKLEIALSLALLIGFIQIAMGVFKLGFVASYLSDPVVSGFTTGSAVVIILSQIQQIFGLKVPRFTGLFSVVKSTAFMINNIPSSNIGSVITGLLCLAALIAIKYVNERCSKRLPFPIPGELIVVVLSTAISDVAKINSRFDVQIVESIPKGFPPISIPSLKIMSDIYSDAFKIAIVIFAINISLAKFYAKKNGQRIDTNQELIAYGACNVGVSFLSGFPVCSALARVVVQEHLAHTQLCSLVIIAVVLLVLLFITHLLFYLPKAVLAAIVIANLIGLLKQFARIKHLWAVCRPDAIVWCITCFGVVFLGIDIGLACGVFSALLAIIVGSSRPRYSILGRISNTDIYRDIKDNPDAKELYGIKIVRFESPLYYVNAECFMDTLHSIIEAGSSSHHRNIEEIIIEGSRSLHTRTDEECHTEERHGFLSDTDQNSCAINITQSLSTTHNLIIDAATFTNIDSMGIAALRSITQEFHKVGIHVYLVNCTKHLRRQLEVDGFEDDVMFVSIHDAVLQCSQLISQQLKETKC